MEGIRIKFSSGMILWHQGRSIVPLPCELEVHQFIRRHSLVQSDCSAITGSFRSPTMAEKEAETISRA